MATILMGVVSATLFVTNATVFAAQGQVAGQLSNLEVGFDKTSIEFVGFNLDQPFSPSRFDYTATVDKMYTANLYITAAASANADIALTINDAKVQPGTPYKVDLKEGDNRFDIKLASAGAEPAVYHLTVSRKDLSREYKSELLFKGVWRILDFGGARGNESFYLVEGRDRALLLDTGMGKGDLPAYLRTLTSLPVDVAITHGHGDHFGQVDEFKDSTVYMSEKDSTLLPPPFVTSKFKWVKDGDIIDLGGGRQFEVEEVPGHTLGSIIYLDVKDKIAVTGDAVSSGSMVYMFGSSCTALDQYIDSLKKMEARVKDMDGLTLLVGHHYQEKTPLTGAAGKQLFTDMRIAAEKVMRGELTGKTAVMNGWGRTMELREAYYGLAGLWYNPENLHTDRAALGLLAVKTSGGQRVILRPIFSSMQTSYSAKLPDQSTAVEVTPAVYWPNAKGMTVNGAAVKSGATAPVELTAGSNKIEIAVTAANGSVRTYTLLIQK
jgi:para-nitrobenzyl esterase